jgi:anti-sigma-K factor RskA
MNRDLALKYQAFVDGELSEQEARAIVQAMESDAEARALVGELRATKAALAGNEPELAVPESREFYWNKIEQGIARLQPEACCAPAGGWGALMTAWRRFLAPLAGVAVIAFLAIAAVKFYNSPLIEDYTQHLAEIENLSEHSTSFSFRSDNMFVVWVQDTPTLDTDGQVEFIDNDDAIPQ